MRTALIVFAKAPVAGQAKTRLIPALGAPGAAALAERLLARALEAGRTAGPAHLELCVSPTADHPAFERARARHREAGLVVTLQGDGDLGARMDRALARALATHDAAMLIGTDAPALDAAALRHAEAALAEHDAVFVPALDGGYALVGLRRPASGLFEGVAWSTDAVMVQSRERARALGLHWAECPPVADLDVPGDLDRLPAALRHELQIELPCDARHPCHEPDTR